MDIQFIYFLCGGLWMIIGLVWLVPRRTKLMMRLGDVPDYNIAQAAKAGDIEAQKFRRDGFWYIMISLAIMLPLTWLRHAYG